MQMYAEKKFYNKSVYKIVYFISITLLWPNYTVAHCEIDNHLWNEAAQTATECRTFYQTLLHCIGKDINESENNKLTAAAQFMSKLEYLQAKTAGLSDAAIRARGSLTVKSFVDKIDHNCINISVLTNEYGEMCKRVVEMWKNKLPQ